MRCWGEGGDGQLGDGTLQDSLVPVDVIGLPSPALAIGAGGRHTCAVFATGVMCWGDDSDGQLGNGPPNLDAGAPVWVLALGGNIEGLAAGDAHTCALKAGGDIVCWGDNSRGQLGGGGFGTDSPSPVGVGDLDGSAYLITAGDKFTCAAVPAGVQCWGDNTLGQLGVQGQSYSLTPVYVAGVGQVNSIGAGGAHVCANERDSWPDVSVHCWGNNSHGQLGNGSASAISGVVHAKTSAYMYSIAGGDAHTCGLYDNGLAQCWGWNDSGQLGDGTNTSSDDPVDVVALPEDATEIAAGYKHTCVLYPDGTVYCWGANNKGQLGCGTTDDAWAPEPVTGLP